MLHAVPTSDWPCIQDLGLVWIGPTDRLPVLDPVCGPDMCFIQHARLEPKEFDTRFLWS